MQLSIVIWEGSIIKQLFKAACVAATAFVATAVHAQDFTAAEMERGAVVAVQDQPENAPLYEVGSIGKFACTIAALRLVDRGELSLNDTIGVVLPEFAQTPIKAVTLRDALANRSGIADGLLPAFGKSPADVMSTPDAKTALMKFATGDLASQSGSTFSYDLVNWIAVQAVIEAASGKTISDVLQAEVIDPAKMRNSRVFIGQIGEGAAPPAVPGRPMPAFLTCAGGLASTPADLLSLARFPHKGGLSKASLMALEQVTTPEEDYTLGGRYIAAKAGHKISWQTGSNGAYKSLVVYDPVTDDGYAAMTASNDNSAIQSARGQWMKRKGL